MVPVIARAASRYAPALLSSKATTKAKPEHYRVPTPVVPLLLAPAIIGDVIQALVSILNVTGILIPFVWGFSMLIYGVVAGIVIVAFIALGVSPFTGAHTGRKLFHAATAFVLENLPVAAVAPMLTIWTLRIIALSRQEDREKAERDATIKQKVRTLPDRRVEPRRREMRDTQPRAATSVRGGFGGSAKAIASRYPAVGVALAATGGKSGGGATNRMTSVVRRHGGELRERRRDAPSSTTPETGVRRVFADTERVRRRAQEESARQRERERAREEAEMRDALPAV